MKYRLQVWDLPTRLFHWLLVLTVMLAWITGDLLGDALVIHQWVGMLIVGLVSFRVTWGLIGSHYARFSQFVVSMSQIKGYLTGQWQGIGHNPLGGWSVLAMLALLTVMLVTGLLSDNDADFTGPLAFLVSTDTRAWLTSLHKLSFKLLLLLIVLHVGAISFYKWILGKDLIQPMISGETWHESEIQPPNQSVNLWALLLALFISGLAMWGASGLWHTPAAKPAVMVPSDW